MSHTTLICLKIPSRMWLPIKGNRALRTVPLSLCTPPPPRGKRLSPPVRGGGPGVSRALFSYKVQQTLVNGFHKALNCCFARHRELPSSGRAARCRAGRNQGLSAHTGTSHFQAESSCHLSEDIPTSTVPRLLLPQYT